jgi:hypothetical protein
VRRLILAVVLAGCASPGNPPGGPEDREPPVLQRIIPDTGAVNVRPRNVIFRFNEVVSERPQGVTSLERLFIVSPRDGDPRVEWRREELAVRPRRGWRPNTVYMITMLPGVADLRGNVRKEQTVVVFSTGPTIPRTQISGIAFDWPAAKPASGALIEAIARPDSTIYVQKADSTGHFIMPHLPPGRYTLLAIIDANGNNDRDPREPWDSVGVTLADSTRVELLAFVHDTIGPRIRDVAVRDSLTLRVGLDKPLDSTQRIDTTLFTLKAADSSIVPIMQVRPAREFEREQADRDRADSTRRGDTTAARPIPGAFDRDRAAARDTGRRAIAGASLPSRPAPPQELILRVFPPFRLGVSYRLTARGVRNLLGYAFTSDKVFSVPKPAPPDTTRAGGARARPAAVAPGARPRSDTLPPTAPRPMIRRDTTPRQIPPRDTTPPPPGSDVGRRSLTLHVTPRVRGIPR